VTRSRERIIRSRRLQRRVKEGFKVTIVDYVRGPPPVASRSRRINVCRKSSRPVGSGLHLEPAVCGEEEWLYAAGTPAAADPAVTNPNLCHVLAATVRSRLNFYTSRVASQLPPSSDHRCRMRRTERVTSMYLPILADPAARCRIRILGPAFNGAFAEAIVPNLFCAGSLTHTSARREGT